MRNTGRGLRWLGHLLVMVVLVAALAPVTPATVVRAAMTDTVTSCSGDINVAGSLPLVLAAAGAGDTIIFAQDCTGGSAIPLTHTLTPTVSVTINAIASTPPHTATITVASGSAGVQLFRVTPGITLGLTGLTLTGGNSNFGGAMYSTGTVNITGCTFSTNTATGGGAIANDEGGTANITASVFPGNTATGGGAILNVGTANITASVFPGNTATDGDGGAIVNFGNGTTTITGSTFSANTTSSSGGAIYNGSDSTITVTGSTFSDNTASDSGGAIYNGLSGMMTITNGTFFGNTASGFGGSAILNYGMARIIGSTLSHNTATDTDHFGVGKSGGAIYHGNEDGGSLMLSLSVVAGNTAPDAPDIKGTVTTDGGGNVIGNTSGSKGLTATTDRTGDTAPLDPLLAPLASNGGSVQTFALLPGSPALNIAPCPTGLTVDARSIGRPQVVPCDAGSFESHGFTTGNLTGGGQSAAITTQFASPVSLSVSPVLTGEPVVGGQITFTITPGTGGAAAAFSTAMGCTLSTDALTAVCALGMSGNATTPPFTANSTAGSFTIVPTAAGIATPVTFTETNTAALS